MRDVVLAIIVVGALALFLAFFTFTFFAPGRDDAVHYYPIQESSGPYVSIAFSPDPAANANVGVPQGGRFLVNVSVWLTRYGEETIANQTGLTTLLGFKVEVYHAGTLPKDYVPFNHQFDPNPVVIRPNATSTSVLTIKVAEDAPLGRYSFSVSACNLNKNLYLTVLEE
ncbi:hypothetical protein KAI12_04905 [Candidatus Bathyarchaeota archaeon]|nr:hypothetical protein [Candidatus Bathyarchaeota archaeon]